MEKIRVERPQPMKSEWAVVRGSAIHGRGMFAVKEIPRGTRVIEYVGERISKAEGWRRETLRQRRAKSGGDGGIFIFELNQKTDLDGGVSWNTARFINHSCRPNCESRIVRGRVWIVALRKILPGEELSYDYCYDYEHHHEHPCRCAAPDCVGFIVKSSQRWRVRRALGAKVRS